MTLLAACPLPPRATRGLRIRTLRRALSPALFAFALVPATAWADDGEDDAPKKRKFVVTVEDSDKVKDGEAEPPAKKKKRANEIPAAPPSGAPEDEVLAYIRALRKDVANAKADMLAARSSDDADEVAQTREAYKEKRQFLKEEEDRLYPKDTGLVAGGAVLTAFGGASMLTSLILLIGWPLSGLDGNFDDELGWASLGCLGGGVLGLAAGIPMIKAGNTRTIRGADEDVDEARWMGPEAHGPRVGVTLRFSF